MIDSSLYRIFLDGHFTIKTLSGRMVISSHGRFGLDISTSTPHPRIQESDHLYFPTNTSLLAEVAYVSSGDNYIEVELGLNELNRLISICETRECIK